MYAYTIHFFRYISFVCREPLDHRKEGIVLHSYYINNIFIYILYYHYYFLLLFSFKNHLIKLPKKQNRCDIM